MCVWGGWTLDLKYPACLSLELNLFVYCSFNKITVPKLRYKIGFYTRHTKKERQKERTKSWGRNKKQKLMREREIVEKEITWTKEHWRKSSRGIEKNERKMKTMRKTKKIREKGRGRGRENEKEKWRKKRKLFLKLIITADWLIDWF